jgi:hypothetical protein
MRIGRSIGAALVIAALIPAPAPAAVALEGGVIGSTQRTHVGIRGTLGTRFGTIRSRRLGTDVGLTAFAGQPEQGWTGSTTLGVVGAIVDIGAAFAAPLGPGLVLAPRLAFTGLASGGEGGGGIVAGFAAALGIVRVPERGAGVRGDVTVRLLSNSGHSETLWSASAGVVWGRIEVEATP